MYSDSHKPVTLKLGSIVFLLLALVLAIASGDTLLVLAVGTAIAGIVLLTSRREVAAVRRPSARPMVVRTGAVARPLAAPHTRRTASRMAVRRYRATALLSRRHGSDAVSQPSRASNASLSEAPSQAQVIQVLQ